MSRTSLTPGAPNISARNWRDEPSLTLRDVGQIPVPRIRVQLVFGGGDKLFSTGLASKTQREKRMSLVWIAYV